MKKAEIRMGETCEKGFQLRPHIVWFGEMVPEMENAAELVAQAEIFITVGTSLVVYPAAGLIHYAPAQALKYLVDPGEFDAALLRNLRHIRQKASEGLKVLQNELLDLMRKKA
jgi:NAD-dependent deacetylase